MQKLIQLKNKKGFTLIEMLVVILIIVILIAIAIPAVAGYRADAQETADEGAAETLFNALEAAATQHPPSEPENLAAGTLGIGRAPLQNQIVTSTQINRNDLAGSASPFLIAVDEFLGSNFDGEFTFSITLSTGSVNWVTYRPAQAEITTANTMLFHAVDGVSGYLDEVLIPGTSNLYTNGNMLHDTP